MRKELAKTYAPKEFEERIYKNWEERDISAQRETPPKSPIQL